MTARVEFTSTNRKNGNGTSSQIYLGKNVKIHPTATIGDYVTLEDNVTIGKCVIIEDFCEIRKRATIGDYSKIRHSSTIGPNCRIGFNVTIDGCNYIPYGTKIKDSVVINRFADIQVKNRTITKENYLNGRTTKYSWEYFDGIFRYGCLTMPLKNWKNIEKLCEDHDPTQIKDLTRILNTVKAFCGK